MVLAASAGLLSTKQATAQEQADPPPHLEFFEAIAGVWDYKLSFPGGEVGGATTGVVNWGRRAHGHTIRGYWTADDGKQSTEILGYRKSDGVLLSNGFGEQGNHWRLILPEVTATSIKGRCVGTHPNGVSFEGAFEGKLDGNTYTFSIDGKNENGEPHAFQGVCQRRIRKPLTGDAARCPWTWMVGEWKCKRSDGTTAEVTWKQPDKEVDVLIGRWVGRLIVSNSLPMLMEPTMPSFPSSSIRSKRIASAVGIGIAMLPEKLPMGRLKSIVFLTPKSRRSLSRETERS